MYILKALYHLSDGYNTTELAKLLNCDHRISLSFVFNIQQKRMHEEEMQKIRCKLPGAHKTPLPP